MGMLIIIAGDVADVYSYLQAYAVKDGFLFDLIFDRETNEYYVNSAAYTPRQTLVRIASGTIQQLIDFIDNYPAYVRSFNHLQ